ncbi:hypothetical protein SLS62_005733 [Diatrype stigma]|uniref:Uncharacterized protein n=1 Tax=Diatrype stigma TaxID=117547 RepID=A0AAN9UUI5_9PEZI
MASTRSTTGNSRPRVHTTVSTGPERKRRSTTGTTTTATKTTAGGARRGRKPGTGSGRTSTGAGVRKPASTSTSTNTGTTNAAAQPRRHHHQKRQPHLVSDKAVGAAEKAAGAVVGRPGKKAAGTRRMRGTDGKGSRSRRG